MSLCGAEWLALIALQALAPQALLPAGSGALAQPRPRGALRALRFSSILVGSQGGAATWVWGLAECGEEPRWWTLLRSLRAVESNIMHDGMCGRSTRVVQCGPSCALRGVLGGPNSPCTFTTPGLLAQCGP